MSDERVTGTTETRERADFGQPTLATSGTHGAGSEPMVLTTSPAGASSSRCLRALIVTEQLRRPVPGGIGRYARGLLQGLVALDDRVSAFPFTGRGDHRLASLLWEYRIRSLPSNHANGPLDVAHATSFAFPSPHGRFRRSSVPLTMFIHDLAWRLAPEAYPARGIAWHERALARAFRDVSDFIVPSNLTADALVTAGVDPTRVHVVPEGSDHLPDASASVAEDERFLLTVSTLEPRKNLATLVEAYSRLRPALPHPWPLRIVGPQGWGNEPPPQAEGVEYLGGVDDHELAQLYANARAFVYVPLLEGFGLPPLEAMRAGVPVLSSAVPSVGESSLVVDPKSASAIADGLLRVLTDESLRIDLQSRGRALAAGRTWKRCAAAHADIWESIVG